MATRRRSSEGKPARRSPARRKAGGARGARHGRTTGAREARPRESARRIRAQEEGEAQGGGAAAREVQAPARPAPAPAAGPAPAGREAGRADAARREAAELARRVEAEVGKAELGFRSGPGAAPERLREHREQVEQDARRSGQEGAPGLASLGLELVVGALRLARSMATAPLRVGVALLRRGLARAPG